MHSQNFIQITLLSVLLALVGFFFMLQNDEGSIEMLTTTKAPTGLIVCNDSPMVRVYLDGSYNHAGRSWKVNELVRHLVVDFGQHPFSAVNVVAEDSVNHQTVVTLSDAIKQQFPEVNVIWESHKELDNSIN